MATVGITGASGFIGSALTIALRAANHDVIRFVRRDASAADEASWDPAGGTIDRAAVERVDAIVNLAGEGIGEKRWTAEQKRKIRESRINGTTTVARALAEVHGSAASRSTGPVLVSGSAVGYYGLRGDEVLTEQSTPGTGFLADVAKEWEAATRPAEDAGLRVVHTRTGIVLGKEGAMSRMLPMFKLGLGGKLGSGAQWWSWISLTDAIGLFRHAIDTNAVAGPMNVTGPEPARFSDVAKALGKVLHRPALLPVPKFALSVVLGSELAEEVALAGQRALPEVALATGYMFEHRSLEDGLRASVL